MASKKKIRWHEKELLVTPEMAEEFMQLGPSNPRPTSKATVDTYAREMARGSWKSRSTIPVAFDWYGVFRNGFHRMHAIIKYGKPVKMIVTWGWDPDTIFDAKFNIRKDAWIIKHLLGVDVLPRSIAAARLIEFQGDAHYGAVKHTPEEKAGFVKKYKKGLDYARSLFPSKVKGSVVGDSPFQAVLARAWYTEGMPEILADFARIIKSSLRFESCESELGLDTSAIGALLRWYGKIRPVDENGNPIKARQSNTTFYLVHTPP